MKSIIPFITVLFFLAACQSPQKFVEKNQYDRALLVSSKQLVKRKKIKAANIAAFEIAFQELNNQDINKINRWKDSGDSYRWPQIYEQAFFIKDRQSDAKVVLSSLEETGFHPAIEMYPVEELIVEAREKSALYYYARAQEHIPPARNGNRFAARTAYGLLENVQNYLPNFKDSPALKNEMVNLGTTHILINPLVGRGQRRQVDWVYDHFFDEFAFPIQKDWQVWHIDPPAQGAIHHELQMTIESIYVSNNIESYSDCTNTKEVEVGTRTEEQWSDSDSAFVLVTIPIIEEVSLTVTTYDQVKKASINMNLQLINLANGQLLENNRILGCNNWGNSWSVSRGDARAKSISCSETSGCATAFPSGDYMLIQSIYDMKDPFWRILNKLDDI